MSNLRFIHRWTLHISHPNDEWDALCGVSNPEFLVDKPQFELPGYKLCPECLQRSEAPRGESSEDELPELRI